MPLESLDVTVPPEAIERALGALPGPDQAQDELLRFARAQPELFAFVRQAATPLGDDAVGQAVYLAFTVWSAFEQAFPGEVKRVPSDEIRDACEAAEQAMRDASAEEERSRRPLERLKRDATAPIPAPARPPADWPQPRETPLLLARAFDRATAAQWSPAQARGALEQAVARASAPGAFFQRQPHLHGFVAAQTEGDLFLLGAGIVEALHGVMLNRAVEEMMRRADKTVRRSEPRVGRNDPCPCGSGLKYKRCHGA